MHPCRRRGALPSFKSFAAGGLAAMLLGSMLAGAGADGGTSAPRRRLLLNNDGTNLLWRNDLTLAMVARHVAECPNAVTTYLLCPNGIQKMLYPSAHEALATRGALPALVAKGEDPFGAMLAGLAMRGFETFVSFRMNEVHNVDNPNEPDLSSFWRDHPEYRVERGQNRSSWLAQCLDYSRAPVREYALALIFELLETYEPDGIELDWMRFPRHLSGDGDAVWESRHHLTEVVARVREKAVDIGLRRGRPMLVAVRVASSAAGCRALGVDIGEWHRRGLIDFVTASPFLSTDFSMPLAELRQVLGAPPIPLYAAIEFGYAGTGHSEASIRAAAVGLFESGADGIYLFNFPCWREEKPHPPWSWVPPLRSPDAAAAGRELLFPVITAQHRIPGIDLPVALPIEIPARGAHALRLLLPAAAVAPRNPPTAARLVVTASQPVKVSINDVAVAADEGVPAEKLLAGESAIAISNPGTTPAVVTLVELRLEYPLMRPLRVSIARTIYASPRGSDEGSGTEAEPFETIARALKAAREVPRDPDRAVAVVLRGGAYRLEAPLVLGPEDHDIVFRAQAGEAPIVSGGVAVNDWREDERGRFKARAKLADFRQLYVNGTRAARARGVCPADVVRSGDMESIDGDAGFIFPDGGMAAWRRPERIELGFYNSWSHMICRVERIERDREGRAVVAMLQPWFFLASRKEGVQAKLPAYVENALELLDEPGEWYFDAAAGELYYRPREGEDMARADVVAPRLETLVRVEGTPERFARRIAFEGIAFVEATWRGPNVTGHVDVQANFTATPENSWARDGYVVALHNEYRKSPANVVVRHAEGVRFERCSFTRLGGAGLDIESGSRGTIVNECAFTDISGSGIQVGDVRSVDHHPPDERCVVRDNWIVNNAIRRVGCEFEDSVGIFAGYADATVIAGNEIADLPYSGISVGWGWGEEDAGGGAYQLPFRYARPTPAGANRIEANHITRVMLRRDDGGGIYLLGNQPGTVIRDNRIHDNGPGGPGGIYLDEGSGFIEVTGNRVYRVPKAMNYNNRAQDRVGTCFEHDNFFDIVPEGVEGDTGPEGNARPAAK